MAAGADSGRSGAENPCRGVNAAANPFNAYAERYDAWFRRSPGRTLFQRELRALRPLLAEVPRRWLEVGVGTGVFARSLDVDVGLDPARAALRRARRRGIKVVQGVGQALPFRDGTFGGVLFIVTLCFAGEPLPLLREAARVLRHQGALVLADIERESPWGRLYQQQAAQGHPLYRLATFWTTEEVTGMLAATGFEVAAATSTLRRGPSEAPLIEEPAAGVVPEAAFVCLLARRTEPVGGRDGAPI